MPECSVTSVQIPPHELSCPSPSLRSRSSSLKLPSAASSLYSIEDSLRDVVGRIAIYARETQSRENSIYLNIEERPPVEEAINPADIPLPESPAPSYRQTTSEFNLRVRELKGNADSLLTGGLPTPPKALDQSPQSLLSALLAACSLKDDKRPKNKGKERERVEHDTDDGSTASFKAPQTTKAYRLSGSFGTPWKRQKCSVKQALPSGQSEAPLCQSAIENSRKDTVASLNVPNPISLPNMIQISFKAGSSTKQCWVSLNAVDTWAKLLGFIRYSSFPEMTHSETQPRNVIIEDTAGCPITENLWPPPKVKKGNTVGEIQLLVSVRHLPSKSSSFLSALISKKRKASATMPAVLVDKKVRKSGAFPVGGVLEGNVVSNVVAFVPHGLQLHITIKLIDEDLGFSYGSRSIKHGGSRLPGDLKGVIWDLETSDDWVFTFPDPDEIISTTIAKDDPLPDIGYEAHYGLRRSAWEPYGSIVVHALKFAGVIQGLMMGLGYPDNKITEYVAFWSSRIEATNPTYVEISALSDPKNFVHGSSISIEKIGDQEQDQEINYNVEITRLLLSFRPFRGGLRQDETSGLRLAVMAKIREQATQRFSLAPNQGSSGVVKTIKIFEAGGMIVYDGDPQQCPMKLPYKEGERRPEGNSDSVGSISRDTYWICCNPDNYDSHGKVGWPMSARKCSECAHDKCLQCLVAGGMRRGSFGKIAHPVNPFEGDYTLKDEDDEDEIVMVDA